MRASLELNNSRASNAMDMIFAQKLHLEFFEIFQFQKFQIFDLKIHFFIRMFELCF